MSTLYNLDTAPMYIHETVEFRAGQVMYATDVNQLFNKLIAQGDYNTEWLTLLATTAEAQAAIIATLQATVTELGTRLDTAEDNIDILLALHERTSV